ncbi:MAG: CrcB family protein [Kiritimatiellae bacterium]|nr:CrcB family protein [Kiritimatiellia bacterium]
MKIIMLISLAGVAGTLARYSMVKGMSALFPNFPWGTLLVNVIGAFLAGFCFIMCKSKFSAYEAYFPVLFLGFLGAFTTFSTFALESSRFLLDAQYSKFLLNVLLQNTLGIGAAIGGFLLTKTIFPT